MSANFPAIDPSEHGPQVSGLTLQTANTSGSPRMSDAEWQKVLNEWNATETAYARDLCLHQLVESQAERTPDASAVEFGGQYLSYEQLNARAIH
ncbi:MAG TPA: hypothetical protein VKT29_09750, partial [Terriglobales bacterium]|nr:hypothetical protein [Terriglobales bacterium]